MRAFAAALPLCVAVPLALRADRTIPLAKVVVSNHHPTTAFTTGVHSPALVRDADQGTLVRNARAWEPFGSTPTVHPNATAATPQPDPPPLIPIGAQRREQSIPDLDRGLPPQIEKALEKKRVPNTEIDDVGDQIEDLLYSDYRSSLAVAPLALRSVATIMSLALVGVYMRSVGMLSVQMTQSIAKMSVDIMIPALLFVAVVECKTFSKTQTTCHTAQQLLSRAWALFLVPAVFVPLRYFITHVFLKVYPVPEEFHNACLAMGTFTNSAALPIVLLTSIKFELTLAVDPLLYLSCYLMSYKLFECIAYNLLQPPKDATKEPEVAGCFATLGKKVGEVFPPPARGALVGFIVAAVPQFRALFVNMEPQNALHVAPLEWLFNAVNQLGFVAIPFNMIILGDSMAAGYEAYMKGDKSVPLAPCWALAVLQLCVLPLIGLASLEIFSSTAILVGPGHRSAWLVTAVMSCQPAFTKALMFATPGTRQHDFISRAMTIQYLFCPITITFWVALYLSYIMAEKPHVYAGDGVFGLPS
jgi:predicted permease